MTDFFLDADVDPVLGDLLEVKGHTARTTRHVGRHDASDDQQLLLATDLGRLLVTHNKRNFVLLYRAWRSLSARWGVAPEEHAGIIALPQPPALLPRRAAIEIDNLVRGARNLWGRFFEYDLKWGWVTGP